MTESANREEPQVEADWPRGIGDLSTRVGYDVRDLILEGYTWDEIHEVAAGKRTLAELRQRGLRKKQRGCVSFRSHQGS